MPQIPSKQIKVSTPINPTDLVDKQFVEQLILNIPNVALSGNSLNVYDEGILIKSGVTNINFIGVDVFSKLNNNTVDIYIPSPNYTPNLTIINENYTPTLRWISNPIIETNPFNVGDWFNDNQQHNTVKEQYINYSSGVFGIANINSNITITVYKIIGNTNIETILAQHTTNLDSNKNVTNDNITINLTNFNPNFDRYEIQISDIAIDLQSLLISGGRIRVNITIQDLNWNYNNYFTDLFYDINSTFVPPNGVTINNLTISENVANLKIKWLSGVQYYTSGSSFIININDIDNINFLSYQNPQIVVSGSEYNLSQLSLFQNNLIGWTNLYNKSNLNYQNLNWDINNTRFYTLTSTGNVSTYPIDWTSGNTISSSNSSIAIDTINDISDRNTEDFANESWRLKQDLTNWSSLNSLLLYDSNSGLQCYNSRLYYPSINYTSYAPNTTPQPNYLSCNGDRNYIRKFIGNSYNSNGIILFSDYNITESDINNGINSNILLELTIDSGLTWWSLNSEFVSNPLLNNSSIRTNINDYNLTLNGRIQFTFGTNSSTYFILKITYKDVANIRTKYIGGIDILGNNWI